MYKGNKLAKDFSKDSFEDVCERNNKSSHYSRSSLSYEELVYNHVSTSSEAKKSVSK